jgi:hypothetical protein
LRHLRSILYAIVLAPAVWILCGVGFTSDLVGRARDSDGVESFTGLLLLLLAGGAYAILVFTPFSPAGPSFAGLVFLGVAIWALASPGSYGDAWPTGVAKEGFDLSRPGYGLAALLAVPLLCTALSAKRWEQYVPPQLPLIGTLGRARGAAAVAGTPVSAVDTAVIEVPPNTDAADATQVIPTGRPVAEPATAFLAASPSPAPSAPSSPAASPLPSPAASPLPSPAASPLPSPAASASPSPSPSPAAFPSPASPAASEPVGSLEERTVSSESVDEATVAVVDGSAEEPTEALVADDEQPTDAIGGPEEPTEAVVADDEQPTDAIGGPEEPTEAVVADDEQPTDAIGGSEEPTDAVVDAEAPTDAVVVDAEAPTDAVAVDAEAPTDAVVVDAEAPTDAVVVDAEASANAEPEQPTEAVAEVATDVPAPSDPGSDEATEATEATEAIDEEETAQAVVAADDQDKTQVVRAPVLNGGIGADGEEKTQVIRLKPADPPAADVDDRPTHAIETGATTQDLRTGELTQVIPVGARTADHGEKTQVINLPGQRTEPIDGDRTQVIRFGSGTVEPPGDRTQVLRFPAQDTQARKVPGEQTTVSHEAPTRANSIVGEERPNPGDDPTTRLVPPQAPEEEPAEQPGEETTVDVGGSKRAMTVTSLERPADEAADDTRQLTPPPIPAQRRPSPDET